MARLKDLKPPIEGPLKVMFVGVSGSWKSSAAASWPGRKHFLDYDSRIYALYKRHLENEDISFSSYTPHQFDAAFKELEALKKNCPYDVLIADSFSIYGDMSMNYSRQMRGVGEGARTGKSIGVLPMNEIMDYGAADRAASYLLDVLFSLPCTCILICHLVEWETTILGDGPARVKHHSKVVSPTAAISAKTPARFNEVWGFRLESSMDGSGNKLVIETTGGSGNELLRTSLGLPSSFEVDGSNLYGTLKDKLSIQKF